LEEALEAESKENNAPENEIITEQTKNTITTTEVMDTSL
jgi:hypothetical protein